MQFERGTEGHTQNCSSSSDSNSDGAMSTGAFVFGLLQHQRATLNIRYLREWYLMCDAYAIGTTGL